MLDRLLALAHQLRFPPEEDLDRILEGGERAFKPIFNSFVELRGQSCP